MKGHPPSAVIVVASPSRSPRKYCSRVVLPRELLAIAGPGFDLGSDVAGSAPERTLSSGATYAAGTRSAKEECGLGSL